MSTDVTAQAATNTEPETGMHRVFSCAQAFAELLVEAYRDEDGQVHAPTVIGAAACVAGEQVLLDSTDELIEGIGYVTSTCANKLMFEHGPHGLTAWECLVGPARQAGLCREDGPRSSEVLAHVLESIGGEMFPKLTVAKDYLPLEWSPAAAPRFRDAFDDVAAEAGLSLEEEALAAAAAAGLLVRMADDAIPMRHGLQLAAELMISQSKMMPLPLEIGQTGEMPTTPETKQPDA